MDFGQAILAMKDGEKVARSGWNGKGMWIAITKGSSIPKELARSGAVLKLAEEGQETITIGDHIDMKSADGSVICGWLASQTDMLAEDWSIIV